MTNHPAGPTMHQKIFAMKLDVETVSLYLLCCAVSDAGGSITQARLLDKWNGGRASLEKELARLEKRNILARREEAPDGTAVYAIVDERQWR